MTPGIFFALGLLAGATDSPAQTPPPAPDVSGPAIAPVLHEVAPGIFDYHGVRLDQKNKRISFPASVNQREGLIEYLLVSEKGKTHESLLSTRVLPHDIHLALLLIGLPDHARANANELVPPSAIDSSYLHAAPKLKGTPVWISVAWTQDGKRQEMPAERWIFNLQTNHAMTSSPWTYNGSMVQDGVFLADQELSIVAVITDPTALVNNPRDGYDNDEIWQVQDKVVPPLDTPVEISIALANPANPKP
jgi:hypothetical protein